MTFSVIIPVYNVEPDLRECLASVSHQTFADWEAICVNDGSTDSSADILSEYAARDIRIRVVSQPNGGLSAARNTGLDNAHGEYILFLDSDDWLESNTLEIIDNNLQSPTSDLQPLDMLCFGGRRYDEATSTYKPADVLTHTTYSSGMDYYNANALVPRDFAFVCVVLRCYRRQFLLDNNLLFREGILHEDNLFTPQACLYAKTVNVIPDTLYNYRVRPGSIMTTRSLRSRQDMIRIANDLSALFSTQSGIDRSVIYRAVTHHYQAAFVGASRDEVRQLLPLIDWGLYHTVSRTRLRHRANYTLLRLCPTLFNKMYS